MLPTTTPGGQSHKTKEASDTIADVVIVVVIACGQQSTQPRTLDGKGCTIIIYTFCCRCRARARAGCHFHFISVVVVGFLFSAFLCCAPLIDIYNGCVYVLFYFHIFLLWTGDAGHFVVGFSVVFVYLFQCTRFLYHNFGHNKVVTYFRCVSIFHFGLFITLARGWSTS